MNLEEKKNLEEKIEEEIFKEEFELLKKKNPSFEINIEKKNIPEVFLEKIPETRLKNFNIKNSEVKIPKIKLEEIAEIKNDIPKIEISDVKNEMPEFNMEFEKKNIPEIFLEENKEINLPEFELKNNEKEIPNFEFEEIEEKKMPGFEFEKKEDFILPDLKIEKKDIKFPKVDFKKMEFSDLKAEISGPKIPIFENEKKNKMKIPLMEYEKNDMKIPLMENEKNDMKIPIMEYEKKDLKIPIFKSEKKDMEIPVMAIKKKDMKIPVMAIKKNDLEIPLVRSKKNYLNIPKIQIKKKRVILDRNNLDGNLNIKLGAPNFNLPILKKNKKNFNFDFLKKEIEKKNNYQKNLNLNRIYEKQRIKNILNQKYRTNQNQIKKIYVKNQKPYYHSHIPVNYNLTNFLNQKKKLSKK